MTLVNEPRSKGRIRREQGTDLSFLISSMWLEDKQWNDLFSLRPNLANEVETYEPTVSWTQGCERGQAAIPGPRRWWGLCPLHAGLFYYPKNAFAARPSTWAYSHWFVRSLRTVAHSCGSVWLLKLKSRGRHQLQGQQWLAFTVKPRFRGDRFSLSL